MHAVSDKQKALQCLQAGRNEDAVRLFQRVVGNNRKDSESWYYLGIVQARLGALAQAEASLFEATRLNSGFGQALYWLGNVRFYQNKLTPAVKAFGQATKRGYRGVEVWNSLGKAQEQSGDYDSAEDSFRKAIKQDARDHAAYANLARTLHNRGKQGKVASLYRKALDLNPGNLKAALGFYLSLPVIYKDKEHLLSWRMRYEEGLRELIAHKADYVKSKVPVNDLLARDGFYLAYQGMDDREVQTQFGAFYRELLGRARPQFMRPLKLRPPGTGKIRIGYLSHYFHRHTVSYYFGDWITRADRDRFEITIYHLDPVFDDISEQIKASCDQYKPISGQLSNIAKMVRADQQDILVYPEVGMHPRHMWLAALRLAPVQCAAWGHPVTTGLASMDYFISAEATEPVDGNEHYSEQLVRLAGMGVSCSAAQAAEPASRAEFGLPKQRRVYLCSQSLFKIHVDMDELFAAIVGRDPEALLVFFRDGRPDVDRVFSERIKNVLKTRNLNPDFHTLFLDRVSHGGYLRMSRLVDVMLDSVHFSGGRTSLDAFACGVPVVTLEGSYSRGRQTSGMFRQLGFEDWIAHSNEDYVNKAVELAKDKARRAEFSGQIMERAPRYLFNDYSAIQSLEDFYRKIVGGG